MSASPIASIRTIRRRYGYLLRERGRTNVIKLALLGVTFAVLFEPLHLGAQEQEVTIISPQVWRVEPQTYRYWQFRVSRAGRIDGQVRAAGGTGNDIRVLVLTDNEFLMMRDRGQEPRGLYSAVIRHEGNLSVPLIDAGAYAIVLDNRKSVVSPKNVVAEMRWIADDAGGGPYRVMVPPEFASMRRPVTQMLEGLGKLVDLPSLTVAYYRCGFQNAFAVNLRIWWCAETAAWDKQHGGPGAFLFTFFHELWHATASTWGYPMWDNEDAADEFATFLLTVLGGPRFTEGAARAWSAQWSSFLTWLNEAAIKGLGLADRHSVSPQRARNIREWAANPRELQRRWFHLLLPKVQVAALRDPVFWRNLGLEHEIESELARRGEPEEKKAGDIHNSQESRFAADQRTIRALRAAVAIYYGKHNGNFPADKTVLEAHVSPAPTWQCAGQGYSYDTTNGNITLTVNDVGSCH